MTELTTKEKVELHHRLLLGDKETGERGLHEMTTEMYEILKSSQKIRGGIKGMLGWLLLISAVVAILKGWALSFLMFLSSK